MTARLIGLMTVVLFLSLAAFGILLSQSEDAMMRELPKTVSDATSKTLAVFVGQHLPGADAGGAFVFAAGDCAPAEFGVALTDRLAHFPAPPDGVPGKLRVAVVEQRWTTVLPKADEEQTTAAGPAVAAPSSSTPAAAADGPPREDARYQGTLILEAARVRAESVPGEGVKARIPVVRREPLGEHRFEVHLGPGAPHLMQASAQADELVFDVPTNDYARLFRVQRERMLWLALGVFAVGTVLSAGIARRFTRPVRQLDLGIRRLSTGDLDTAVEVRGKDEVARLGLAFNDMTRRLRAARLRAREVARGEKLSALGRLAAGVAHDVRNPLHSISLTLQHLRETSAPEAPEKAREFERSLDLIRGEIHRLDRLIGNFLRFAENARGDRAVFGEIDAAALLTETAQLVGKEAERRGVALELDVGDDLPRVRGNLETLRSALLNLVLNSFEAMPGGGALALSATRAAGGLLLEVRDTGVGIAEEDQDKVFEFGYTTRDGGSGLGLAMVHQVVVEEHGGRVSLESEPGAGTAFRLLIPDAAAEEAAA